jgi:hypothetical protein
MKRRSAQIVFMLLAAIILYSCTKKDIECTTCNPNNPPASRPVANVGPDQTIILPTDSVTLDGSASKPGSSNITSYFWVKVSGPARATMSTGSESTKRVTNMVSGVYQFQLTVTDAAGLYSKDTVKVIVLPVLLNNDTISIISSFATLTSIGSLSQAKTVVPATAADKLVFAGGYLRVPGSWEPTATVDIYNLSANTWSTAQLSETRGGITVATVSNKILYAGGFHNDRFSSRVDIYDAAANTWSTAELSMPRSQMTTAVAGNKVFFAGWEYSGFTDRIDIYDASSNSWSAAALSEARTGMSVIAVGNKVLFAGGYRKFDGLYETEYDFSARVDIYDIVTHSWSTAELKEARSGMAAGVAGNKVLFAGGYHITDPVSGGSTVSDRVDIYDVSTNSWSTTTLVEARRGMVAATVGNKVLFAGGGSNKVDIYDALTNNWSNVVLSQPREVSSTVIFGTKVLFSTGHANFNRMDIYDASANTWSALELNKSLYSIPIVAGNRVFIGGGEVHSIGTYADAHFTSNVWKLDF